MTTVDEIKGDEIHVLVDDSLPVDVFWYKGEFCLSHPEWNPISTRSLVKHLRHQGFAVYLGRYAHYSNLHYLQKPDTQPCLVLDDVPYSISKYHDFSDGTPMKDAKDRWNLLRPFVVPYFESADN